MANTYYDMTGLLFLDRVTEIIEALFGGYTLDKAYPGNGRVYIADVAESSNTSWEAVAESLTALAEVHGIPESTTCDLDLWAPAGSTEILRIAKGLFGVEYTDVRLAEILDDIDWDAPADLATLAKLAKLFNDGHNLRGYSVQGAWHCDRPRLGEFGGDGEYMGNQVHIAGSSSFFVGIGEDLETSLTAGDTSTAASLIYHRMVLDTLKRIHDTTAREAVRQHLAALLTAGSAEKATSADS